MSRFQRAITSIAPATWAASMETASRAWIVRCPACAADTSIWDMGGILWISSGTQLVWRHCPACRKRGWQNVFFQGPSDSSAPNQPEVPEETRLPN